MKDSLLNVDALDIQFPSKDGAVHAVRGISFDIQHGEAVAVVGESGSGKSVTGLSLTGLLPPEPVSRISGTVQLEGRSIMDMKPRDLRRVRGKEIAYVFQEPGTSLNPVFTVGYQIAEAVHLHRPDVRDVRGHVVKALDQVGIRQPSQRYDAYPHELSGGMQQRVMIAMALACEPKLLVADEPTTALDVTIQKQIIDLLRDLKKNTDMSFMLITHNFSIVKDFADRVLVMFEGRIVESGETEQVLKAPQHPYTQALIECIPRLGQNRRRLMTIDREQLRQHLSPAESG